MKGKVTIQSMVVINTPIDAKLGLTSNSFAKIAFVAAAGIAAIIVHIEITISLQFKSFNIKAVINGMTKSLIKDV